MGISLSLRLSSSRQIPAGFFRVHLWVVMGITVLATLVGFSLDRAPDVAATAVKATEVNPDDAKPGTATEATAEQPSELRPTLALLFSLAVVTSYVGASCWFYHAHRMGRLLTTLTALLLAAQVGWTAVGPDQAWTLDNWPQFIGSLTAAMLLGTTITAMLLGHWYLNEPGMQLAPLNRLLNLVVLAIIVRVLVCGSGVIYTLATADDINARWWMFVTFRWLGGFAGLLLLTIMARLTLRIPNTQSATGILYAATILAILGELTSQLLSDTSGIHL